MGDFCNYSFALRLFYIYDFFKELLSEYLRWNGYNGKLDTSFDKFNSAALGAAYKCVDHNPSGFNNIQMVIMSDANVFPVVVDFKHHGEPGNDQARHLLYDRMTPIPQERILTFERRQVY